MAPNPTTIGFKFPHVQASIWDDSHTTFQRAGLLHDNDTALEDFLKQVYPFTSRLEINTTPQLVPTGAGFTVVTFDSLAENTLQGTQATGPWTTLITPIDGHYDLEATIIWAVNAAGIRDITIQDTLGDIHGLDIAQTAVGGGYLTTQQIRWIGHLRQGDALSVGANQTSGGNLNVIAFSWFNVALLGPWVPG